MREIIALNNNWFFNAEYKQGMEALGSLEGFQVVNLPHTNVETPYNYFDENIYQIISCYKYPLNLSKELQNKLLYIRFEGVMAYAKVFLNSQFVGEHKGGYTPFDVRIDDTYDWNGGENILTVVVDSTERCDTPPFGGQIDYLTYGGIYREVSLMVCDKVFIKNLKIETDGVREEEKSIRLKLYLQNSYRLSGTASLTIRINGYNGSEIHQEDFSLEVEADRQEYSIAVNNLKGMGLWDIDEPNLYTATIEMNLGDCTSSYSDCFGFRTAEFTPQGFFLNGRKVKLVGLNRHQSYPYVGYAMPKRVQIKDADILKNELHLNMVRTSHYPQSKHFLRRCDELGLLVFEEIPGWQHIGDDDWKESAKETVREMITRDWNHPSIVIWGVRINESQDDDDFYRDTNKIAKKLDSTRQTGGVRYITNSRLLEDVYTFNDFNHDGVQDPVRDQQAVTGLNRKVPYLITEYNGHMYPTKRFDQEERQMEHSLRHLRVQNAVFEDDSISGAIGWCAFDYNTHKDFGSGDRICYHGVMDMFRIPKLASHVYRSQISPEVEPVLEPITFWARGERSIGGTLPLVILTNCDYVEFKYGNREPKRVYPRRDEYGAIPYAPVIIDYSVIKPEEAGAWGMLWEDAELTGFYQDQQVVSKKLCKSPVPAKLYAVADDIVLNASEKDATRVVVKVLDQCDNLLPFLDDIIRIDVTGPGRLQGPREVVLKGGAVAFWVETTNQTGSIDIQVTSTCLGQKNIKLDVR